MSFRLSRATVTVGNGAGVNVRLPLPFLEGRVNVPIAVKFVFGGSTPGFASMGLSHWRDHPGAVDANASFHTDDSLWSYWAVATGGVEREKIIDLRAFEIELAGPQTFVVFNGSGSSENFAVFMWYDVKVVDIVKWALIARRTSFEDPE